jgi:phosphatidylethanolamine-binding protein (PEBP) family uncharacterized protein
MRVLLDVSPTYQRLLCLATAFFLVPGCGDKSLDKPLPTTKVSVTVTLPWRDGAPIPRKYTCDGGDRRPAIRTSAKRVAVVMTDPDAPGGTFVHWTRWGSTEGKNSFGRTGYSGPCPPKGGGPHRYVVTVYALKQPLGLGPGEAPEKVIDAIADAATGSGSSTGTYGR